MNSSLQKTIAENLKEHLLGLCGLEEFSTILNYGVLPAGKLFRPKLALASFLDQNPNRPLDLSMLSSEQNIALILSALEIHHAYTLIHDDLPCMDDDDYRRGRESTHKKFGQWQAVLAGDALLHHSHKLIGKCRGDEHYTLRAIFNWALGAKGLILGQVLDLSGLINENFSSLLRTHELKTGRLIQTSLLAGKWAASKQKISFTEIKATLRLGSNIGIVFQLLDDLSELTEELSKHERDVNPFLRFPKEAFHSLKEGHALIRNCTDYYLSEVLGEYFKKMGGILKEDLAKSENSYLLRQLEDKELETPIKALADSL